MDLASIEDAVALAEQRWPGLEFHITGNEAHSACPICGQADEDGFVLFEDGGFFCRPGGHTGWLDDDQPRKLTETEINTLKVRQLERFARDLARRQTALERMHQCQDHIKYHKALDEDARRYWHGQGMFDETIDRYLLGFCYRCPTDSKHRASWTIPVINHGKLDNIRHRLFAADGDRYRPHMAGLGSTLFLADNLDNGYPDVLLCEGEKKALVTQQYGFNCVAIMGKSNFPPAWATRFTQFERVNVLLDPDATDRAIKIAKLFNGRGHVVTLPEKADDFFVRGGTAANLRDYMRYARKVS